MKELWDLKTYTNHPGLKIPGFYHKSFRSSLKALRNRFDQVTRPHSGIQRDFLNNPEANNPSTLVKDLPFDIVPETAVSKIYSQGPLQI